MTRCPHCINGTMTCPHGRHDRHPIRIDEETGKVLEWCPGGPTCSVCAGTGRLPGT